MSIKEVSAATGLPKSTLRYWEKVFSGYISPLRTTGGQRRYSEDHCQLFEKIKILKHQGKKIADIKQIFIRHNRPEYDSQASSIENVELLARRIADIVSKEVIHFLAAHEHHTDP
jgi:DNA-binding transcriptional MerR regulator